MGLIQLFNQEPMLFGNGIAITDTDVDALAERYAQAMALRQFEALPSEEAFFYKASTVQIADLVINTGHHTPIQLESEEADYATVMFIWDGQFWIQAEGHRYTLEGKRALLYLPGCPFSEQTTAGRGALFSVSVERLLQTAQAMAGFQLGRAQLQRRLQQPQHFPADDHDHAELRVTLLRLLKLLDVVELGKNSHLDMLQLDETIYRTLALLLCGDLIQLALDGKGGKGLAAKGSIIESLLEWITGHLDGPISLGDLERQTGYSQRTLRNEFQRRFQCSPNQWIRLRRLEAARERLLHPTIDSSVGSVAAAYGYRHLSQFSRDFQECFGVKPSDLLRQGLRRQP